MGTVCNLKFVYQIKQSLVNNKLSNDELAKYLDGWPNNNNNRYCKQIITMGTVSNLKFVYQIKQSLVNNKLSNDEPAKYLDGWPNNNRYCKQSEAWLNKT